MKYNLYDGSRQKAYMQLYLEVRKDIIRGIYGYGKKRSMKMLLLLWKFLDAVTNRLKRGYHRFLI